MDAVEALSLCDRWLPLWTGNRPDELIEIYAVDVFYRDPAKPDGIHGKAALLAYFRKLLAANPDWVWRADEVFPNGSCHDRGVMVVSRQRRFVAIPVARQTA